MQPTLVNAVLNQGIFFLVEDKSFLVHNSVGKNEAGFGEEEVEKNSVISGVGQGDYFFAIGRRTIKVVPRLISLFTSMVPWCFLIMPRLTESPSPVP